MTTPWRNPPPILRRARARRSIAAAALAFCPLWAAAQQVPDALSAADPATPVPALAPLTTPPMAGTDSPTAPPDVREALARWRQANERVAEFPRGHIDLLRWEAQQKPSTTPAAAAPGPTPLSADEAVRRALALRPDLLERPGAGTPERWERHRARIALQHSVRRAWATAVAAHASLRHQQAVLESASIGTELGQRMVEAGNWSQARLQREQLTQAREHQTWLQARQSAHSATEALARLLGLWSPDALQALPQRLPTDLPEVPPQTGPAPTEAQVLDSQPALAWQAEQMRRQRAAVPAAQRQAWAAALAEALQAAPAQPPAVQDLRLLRDHTLERAVRAEAQLLQAASERRSWAREAWARLQTAQASDHHAQAVMLPLLQAAEQETLLRYNGMLQSTWDLLAAARARLTGAEQAVRARRDHWLAHDDWQALLDGGDFRPATGGDSASSANATPDGDH